MDAVRRFESLYEPVPHSGCWLWTGFINRGGYGRFRANGHKMLAHRFSWALVNGSIPGGQCVLHKCDTPCCVNPNHLFLGSKADNNEDKVRKHRQSMGIKHAVIMKRVAARGERAARAKLSDKDVEHIRADTRSPTVVARDYGVHPQCIKDIRSGRTHKCEN